MITFEWDENKNTLNKIKHKISFQEAKSCFYDPEQIAFYDPEHSNAEDREILIGHSEQNRLMMVVYTLRNEKIRIISARKASKQEIKTYENGL